ncbi:MAG: DUF4249 domain-containing protein [Bacteroidia bacterium]|nr:DUF4249 domain-containing protein [Bacteroidia bacterium]
MRYFIVILFFLILVSGCVSEYIPGLKENEEMLVVEGMISDQPGESTVNIYKTLPIWTRDFRTDVENCKVWITDDLGNEDLLRMVKTGTYVTDSAAFRGIPGRIYTLHFTAKVNGGLHTYESIPMKMIPVPPIDTIYFEKRDYTYQGIPTEGCQIYLDTHDPSDLCKFYRWDYSETWEFRLPFDVVKNRICWASEISKEIMIRNNSIITKDRILGYPLKLIENPVDRLSVKYSILVNQYSMNEDEYYYWERLKNSAEQVGGLYDIIPSTIPGNVFCMDDNLERVLGYFSVSSVASKRIFIKKDFTGRNGLYDLCLSDTLKITTNMPDTIPGLRGCFWMIYDYSYLVPPYVILTKRNVCGDCTSRGTNVKPDYWDEDK